MWEKEARDRGSGKAWSDADGEAGGHPRSNSAAGVDGVAGRRRSRSDRESELLLQESSKVGRGGRNNEKNQWETKEESNENITRTGGQLAITNSYEKSL